MSNQTLSDSDVAVDPTSASASATKRREVDRIARKVGTPLELKEADHRYGIAKGLIVLYAGLLAFSFVVPVALFWMPRPSGGFDVTDVRDVMQALSSGMASLVGILGFVVGYYFKSIDKPSTQDAKSKRSK